MSPISSLASWPRRILFVAGGLAVFSLLFILALRLTVMEMFRGVESSRATSLAASPSWDAGSMWSSGRASVDYARIAPPSESRIARNSDLRTRSSSFDRSVVALHQIVSAHHGYLEDLRTESRSGQGRVLAASLSVAAPEFDATVSDLKALGRTEAISVAGEDSAIKLASSERHLAATQTNLSRLQKLQQQRKGTFRDAVALEKDIAQASEAVAEAKRQHEGLLSTVAQSLIRLTLIEDYRPPLEINVNDAFLSLRNSLVEGAGATFSSASLVLGVLFEFGLPLLFWAAVLFWPGRFVWRRFHGSHAVISTAP
jgi:Domain of unknown function (DUF4349)